MAKNYSYRDFFGGLIDEQNRIEIYFEKRIQNQQNGHYEIEIISVNEFFSSVEHVHGKLPFSLCDLYTE